MKERIFKLISGVTLSSFAITCIIHSGLGIFPVTAMNMSLANLTGLTLGTIGLISETAQIGVSVAMKEKIGWATVANASLGSILIDVFNVILPYHPLMVGGTLLIPLAWSLLGKSRFSDTSTNILTNAILKRTKKKIGFIRLIQESLYLSIGAIAARNMITPFTFVLTFGLGYLLQIGYKILRYNPTEIEHESIKLKIKK